MKRRSFIGSSFLGGFLSLTAFRSSASVFEKAPKITHGLSIGEVSRDSALLWCRTSEAAKVYVDISVSTSFSQATRIVGPTSDKAQDYNVKVRLQELEPSTKYFLRVSCENLGKDKALSEAELGSFTTASVSADDDIRFCWSGDTAGQGYGIDVKHGGMLTYKSMLDRKPDFFVHCGDQIYADNPIPEVKQAPDGVSWHNLLTLGKAKVAETVQEFRENYYYNFLDQHVKTFHREVPVYHMWDDHEVVNNWYHGEILEDDRYTEKRVSVLANRAKQAFVECLPVNAEGERKKLYRHISRGPLLDLFFIDLRSYKSKNSLNRQEEYSENAHIFGPDQLSWLKESLFNSKGLWKIICIDMPLSIRVTEWGTDVAENAANGPGEALGRELEYKALLSFIKENDIQNVHFITADVHYCASYYCDPKIAEEKAFKPFWEFVSGPLHAGTFGPNQIDPTFGPKAEFIGLPESFPPAASPAMNLQFFGEIDIDAKTKNMHVKHINRLGEVLWHKELRPEHV